MAAKHYRFYDKPLALIRRIGKAASLLQQLKVATNRISGDLFNQRPDKPCNQAVILSRAKSLQISASLQPEPLSHKEINQQLGLNNVYTQQVETFHPD